MNTTHARTATTSITSDNGVGTTAIAPAPAKVVPHPRGSIHHPLAIWALRPDRAKACPRT